jgi:HAD superfamily hydrolase (TIGR01509 family)
MFEAIIFDFDGTLVDFVDSDTQSLRYIHSLTGSGVCFDDFLETAVDEIMKFYSLDDPSIDPLSKHRYRLKNTFTKHRMLWDDNYVDMYKKELLRTCVPFDGIETVLSKIKQKVTLGLITNADDVTEQRERIKSSGLNNYFDDVVIAGDLGIYKPDPAIFLYLLNRFNVAPEKSLYIGDSEQYDICGAKAAGMKTALFSHSAKRDSAVSDYVINGVNELEVFIDKAITREIF